MNLWPVIERELRAEARNPATQWVRLIGAGVMLLAAAEYLNGTPGRRPGQELFGQLHHFLFITVWVLVPLMTADCVSRERREETLGLLFLTPLKSREIVMAKSLAHGARAATFCLAVVPMMILPLLLGGVAWTTVAASLLANASAFLWALAAGLLASVLSRSMMAALIQALIWAAVFLVVLSLLNGVAVLGTINQVTGGGRSLPSSEWLAGMGLLALWNADQLLDAMLQGTPRAAHQFWLVAGAVILLVSFGGLVIVWQVGAWRLKRTWQELPRSKMREDLERQFCQPRFATALFRATMRRQMERNPIGWLERRQWTSRARAWIWFGVLCVGYSVILFNFSNGHLVRDVNSLVVMGLAGALALTSAASFRRERETGVLELLLTTPLSPEQIVRGRLRGIWVQFLPSLMILASMSVFTDFALRWNFRIADSLIDAWSAALLVLTIPVGGLWLSLSSRHYMVSLALTIGVTVILPWGLANATWLVNSKVLAGQMPATLFLLCAILVSVSLGGWGILKLRGAIGRLGWVLVTGLLIGVAAMAVRHAGYLPGSSRHGLGWTSATLTAGFQLAVAGFAHRQLLRGLRLRTFAFKS